MDRPYRCAILDYGACDIRATRNHGITYGYLPPYVLKQLRFGNHAIAVANQIKDEIENARLYFELRPVPANLVRILIDLYFAKRVFHAGPKDGLDTAATQMRGSTLCAEHLAAPHSAPCDSSEGYSAQNMCQGVGWQRPTLGDRRAVPGRSALTGIACRLYVYGHINHLGGLNENRTRRPHVLRLAAGALLSLPAMPASAKTNFVRRGWTLGPSKAKAVRPAQVCCS